VCVCVCVRACVRACVRVCVCVGKPDIPMTFEQETHGVMTTPIVMTSWVCVMCLP